MRSRIRSEGLGDTGGVLIVILIVSLFIAAAIQAYSLWIRQIVRLDVSTSTKQGAFDLADSGIYSVTYWLRSPGSVGALKPGIPLASITSGAPAELSSSTVHGRYDVSLCRNMVDSSLVDAYSTGYYYLRQGPYVVDPALVPGAGRRAARAVIHAQIRVRYVGDFFAAVPTTLKVGYGSDLSGGDIYGKNIDFQPKVAGLPRTVVRAAYYLQGYSQIPLNYVTLLSTPPVPTQLSADPNLVSPDSFMQAQYLRMAGATTLPGGTTLTGSWPSSPPANVYKVVFSSGNLHLGAPGTALVVTDTIVIFSAGEVYIHGNILPNPGAWLGVISTSTIHIATDAPNTLAINGTFITGTKFVADGNARPTSSALTFNGGFVAQTGVDFVSVWKGTRTYSFSPAISTMALPYFTYFESYAETH